MSAHRVGWVGLGAMGSPMAEVLAGRDDTEMRCFDVVDSRVTKLAAAGGLAARSAADVATNSDAVFVMVATPAQLQDVLFGGGRLAEGLQPGTVLVIMATVGPEAVVEAAARLAERGVDVVDAPVSGGVRRAAAGDLLILASGPAEARRIVEPLLDAMAREVFIFGAAPGDAQRVKLINQLLCGAHIVLAAEALILAEAMGLDAEACWQAVRRGAAASFMLDDRGERMLHPSDEVFSAVSIFAKDMSLVSQAAAQVGYRAELAEAARGLYDEASHAGFSSRDDSTIAEFLRLTRRRSG